MKSFPCLMLLAGWLLTIGFVAAQEGEEPRNAKLDLFRKSFEKRLNKELDAHGNDARKLRTSYLEALEKLKGTLGREEKLKAAAQVVAEIEAIEDGEDVRELPAAADYRLKNLRKKWDEGLSGVLKKRSRQIEATTKIYLKALDEEKRKLTRAGKIKDALLFEKEAERVQALPEIQAVLAEPENEAQKTFVVQLEGQTYSYLREEFPGKSLTLKFLPKGRAAMQGGAADIKWTVTEERTVILTNSSWKTKLQLVFSEDGKSYEGKAIPQGTWRRGKLLKNP